MIKEVVFRTGLLQIATGTFVCVVGDPSKGQLLGAGVGSIPILSFTADEML